MSNKSAGTSFEKEFAKMLANHGFWVRPDKGTAQACDMIAGRNDIIYLFECKVCNKDYFDISRIEDNQDMSRKKFKDCKNSNAWIVYRVEEKGIYLSKKVINKPSNGIILENWFKCTEVWEMVGTLEQWRRIHDMLHQ